MAAGGTQRGGTEKGSQGRHIDGPANQTGRKDPVSRAKREKALKSAQNVKKKAKKNLLN